MTAKKTAKKTTKTRKPKPIEVVTKKVLLKIADRIHNPVTGDFLKLCKGTLQNGPDPDMPSRTMHCALGELYYIVTGKQPHDAHVSEEFVASEITKRTLVGSKEGYKGAGSRTEAFRESIYLLMGSNDSSRTFKQRASNVAKALRKAAELIP
jgi:hypothetical protein